MEAAIQPAAEILIRGGRKKADECLSMGNDKIKHVLARIDPQDRESLHVTKSLIDANSAYGLFCQIRRGRAECKCFNRLHTKRDDLQTAVSKTLGNIRSVKTSHALRHEAELHLEKVHPDRFDIGDIVKALPTAYHPGHAPAQIGVSHVYPSPGDNILSPSAGYGNNDVYPSFEGAGCTLHETGPNNPLEIACVEPGGNTRAQHLTRCGLYLNAYVKYAPNASEDTGMSHANPSGCHPASSTSRNGPGGRTVDPELNLSCPVCNQELDSVAELKDHNKFYHQPCKCPGCHVRYNSRFEREFHLVQHTDHWKKNLRPS
ncbi:hypothetical protein BU17DRAFT_69980 [Hysterangium stoloniferum]|nr:hypothetical protein BU17DRAFT_69980 [Hysterangium stoloniferum]